MDRRQFFRSGTALAASGLAAGAVLAQEQPRIGEQAPGAPGPQGQPRNDSCSAATQPMTRWPQQEQFRIGYTSNTRGGWEGDPWKGISEGREVGFRYFEIFGNSFGPQGPNARPRPGAPEHITYYPDNWEALQHRMWAIGAQFIAITGGEPGKSTDFHDPSKRKEVIDSHFNMTRFGRRFGCTNQKTNLGVRKPGGTPLADMREMAITCQELGKRCWEELGVKFGVHAHLGNQLQSEREIDHMMENTRPEHVFLVLDTGHITMAGMDPLALAKKYGNRVIEYHLKDVAKKDLGGAKVVPPPTHDMMKDPYFFPLGEGGVDFVGLKQYLESINWRGCLNVELDTSPWRAPKESARMSADYIRNTLKIEL